MTSEDIQQLAKTGRVKDEPLHEEIIETHISWLLFSNNYALKIKKPVQFSFADLSTKKLRRYYCEEEIKLNRRLSNIYLEVLAVEGFNGNLKLTENADDDQAIDYAVLMHRMEPDRKMDQMLKNGQVKEEHLRKLSGKLASFHKQATVVHKPPLLADMQDAFNDLEQSVPWVAEHLGEISIKMMEESIAFSNQFLRNNFGFIEKRVQNGWVRDVHGDLHTANIFLMEEPVIFDCIEFSEKLRQLDLLDELAFLCMDMEALAGVKSAERFLQVYLSHFDLSLAQKEQQLFTYFKSYRANVRAKVTILKAGDNPGETELEKVTRYLQLMASYASHSS